MFIVTVGDIVPDLGWALFALVTVGNLYSRFAPARSRVKTEKFARTAKALEISERGIDRLRDQMQDSLSIINAIPGLDSDMKVVDQGKERTLQVFTNEEKTAAAARLPRLVRELHDLRRSEQTERERFLTKNTLSHDRLDSLNADLEAITQEFFRAVEKLLNRPDFIIVDPGQEMHPSLKEGALVFVRNREAGDPRPDEE